MHQPFIKFYKIYILISLYESRIFGCGTVVLSRLELAVVLLYWEFEHRSIVVRFLGMFVVHAKSGFGRSYRWGWYWIDSTRLLATLLSDLEFLNLEVISANGVIERICSASYKVWNLLFCLGNVSYNA